MLTTTCQDALSISGEIKVRSVHHCFLTCAARADCNSVDTNGRSCYLKERCYGHVGACHDAFNWCGYRFAGLLNAPPLAPVPPAPPPLPARPPTAPGAPRYPQVVASLEVTRGKARASGIASSSAASTTQTPASGLPAAAWFGGLLLLGTLGIGSVVWARRHSIASLSLPRPRRLDQSEYFDSLQPLQIRHIRRGGAGRELRAQLCGVVPSPLHPELEPGGGVDETTLEMGPLVGASVVGD